MSTLLRVVTAGVAAITLSAGAVLMMRTGIYGLTLFVFSPVLIGVLGAALIPARLLGGATSGLLSVLFASLMLLALGQEGAICIVMVLPLSLPLGAFGGWLVRRSREAEAGRAGAAMLALVPIGTLGFDVTAKPQLFEVRTTIEINARPEQVWKHVVTFSELPQPEEWFFNAGVAYPQRARIEGSGVGAIRYCEFSTGAFVEPIEVWNEPTLLKFRVTDNPPPMREWSPYGYVNPRHLHGYLVSKQGQFRLTDLGDGKTRLEGTTWYQHGLWPSNYWRWWSDAIIHRIHLRVLHHIQNLSEHT